MERCNEFGTKLIRNESLYEEADVSRMNIFIVRYQRFGGIGSSQPPTLKMEVAGSSETLRYTYKTT
jgi:hypothetical protein